MPERPTNARIVHADGTELPLELAYRGVDEHGVHIWVSSTPLAPGDDVKIGVLPPQSGITFEVEDPG